MPAPASSDLVVGVAALLVGLALVLMGLLKLLEW